MSTGAQIFPSGDRATLTDAELRASVVPVSNTYLTNQFGTWGATTGTLSGTGTVTKTGRCIGVRVFASAADGSFTMTGVTGTVTVRSGTGVDINPLGTLIDVVVTWVSGTIDVIVEALS